MESLGTMVGSREAPASSSCALLGFLVGRRVWSIAPPSLDAAPPPTCCKSPEGGPALPPNQTRQTATLICLDLMEKKSICLSQTREGVSFVCLVYRPNVLTNTPKIVRDQTHPQHT